MKRQVPLKYQLFETKSLRKVLLLRKKGEVEFYMARWRSERKLCLRSNFVSSSWKNLALGAHVWESVGTGLADSRVTSYMPRADSLIALLSGEWRAA